jgi:RHS repeat-associated protein
LGCLCLGEITTALSTAMASKGQEKDDEIAGSGNSYTAEYWQYDSRLGRRWNVDPITYPWQSSYAAFNNNPIYFTDPLGLEGDPPTGGGGGGLSKAGDPLQP